MRVDCITRLLSGQWWLTAGDEAFECGIIVNCVSFWTDEIARMIGTRVPITNMEHQYLVTKTMPEVAALGCELPTIRDTDSQYCLR